MHGQEHMPAWTCAQSGLVQHTQTHSHIHTQAWGPGQNRVNPSTAGGGNPMQVTYIKESRASRGGLMMTKQGWWMLAGTVSWTWVGLHTGEDTQSGTCQKWGRGWKEGGKVGAREGGVDALMSAGYIYIFHRNTEESCKYNILYNIIYTILKILKSALCFEVDQKCDSI